uniref:Uncharacterized protein n=1 Tax=Branchiostoma floridae TaxID=7739 RepID=C3Y860_BRAFL|eukprot:XP_002607519.1 hypothetical protein BRAFLDRAFT_69950 [Branchiostoma floridae]
MTAGREEADIKAKADIAKLQNTMADGAAAQKSFNKMVEEYREEVLPDVVQNCTDPSQPARMVYDAVAVQEENVDHVPNFNYVRAQLERRCPCPSHSSHPVCHGAHDGEDNRGLPSDLTFQHVKTRVRQLNGHCLRPRRVVMDFEVGLMTATETESVQMSVSVEKSSEKMGAEKSPEEMAAMLGR